MNHQELDRYLRDINEVEARQRTTNANINDLMVIHELQTGTDYFRMPDTPFFKEGPIHIRKHNRFAPMPLHQHSFIELNYIYSGTCSQRINGKDVVLQEGQACLLDSEVVHSIEPMGENDILINLLMKKETFTSSFLSRFGSNGIVSEFLAAAITENTNHNRYILFESETHDNLHFFMKHIMCEAFGDRVYAQDMIYNYMMVIFTELMRVYTYTYRSDQDASMPSSRSSLIQILDYIETNFRTCTLSELAGVFSFNANYLGNMLKKKTGKTFIELIKTQRMHHAAALLENTELRIEDIAQESGYSSLGFFYRTFAEHYSLTPIAYRNKRRQQSSEEVKS